MVTLDKPPYSSEIQRCFGTYVSPSSTLKNEERVVVCTSRWSWRKIFGTRPLSAQGTVETCSKMRCQIWSWTSMSFNSSTIFGKKRDTQHNTHSVAQVHRELARSCAHPRSPQADNDLSFSGGECVSEQRKLRHCGGCDEPWI